MMCDISYSGEWEQAHYSYGNYEKKTTEILAGFPKNMTNCVPGEIRIFPGQLVKKIKQFWGKQDGWALQLSPEGHLLH